VELQHKADWKIQGCTPTGGWGNEIRLDKDVQLELMHPNQDRSPDLM
jgi:hypothetical protein